MFKIKHAPLLLIFILITFTACNNSKEPQLQTDTNANTNTIPEKENIANDALPCTIAIDDKKFTIVADNISTAYEPEDSSITITFKGFNEGRLLLRIPNFFKAPCKIPTGYISNRTKKLWVNSAGVASTAELILYPTEATSFNNLNDGRNIKAIVPDAAEITAVQKLKEYKSDNRIEYLVTGKIHTTMLKNVFHTDAGAQNKDYNVTGDFAIKANIYYLD